MSFDCKSVKVEMRVRDIRLVEDAQEVECQIEGFGAMRWKSELVKRREKSHQPILSCDAVAAFLASC